MKRFLIKISLFSLLLLFVVAIGFILPVTPRASKSLLYAKIQKDSLLVNTGSPRLIFVGGSNLSFGINSSLVKDSLKMNPINTAIHASIGLQYMMDNTIQYLKQGDIVILSPEYNHFYGRFVYGGEELLRTVVDIDIRNLFHLSEEQLENISKYFLKYNFSKFKPTEYFGFKESDVFSVNSFNQYGDAYKHWTMGPEVFTIMDITKEIYNPITIILIEKFNNELEKKGAKLFITYPDLQASSYDKNIKQIEKVENELKKSNFNLLGTPERYRMPDSMMFNTPYHLLKTGVDYRTQLLIEDIIKVQTHNNAYKK